MTQQQCGATFSPLIKNDTRNQDLLNAEPTLIEDEGDMSELTNAKPLQTEVMVRKFGAGTRRYEFDSKPIVKRLKSQNKEIEKVNLNDSMMGQSKY